MAALAHGRSRRHLTGTDPLGPASGTGAARAEREHLAHAPDLYRQARITDRLERIRARAATDRARLQQTARTAADRETTERRARTAARSRPDGPRPGPGPGEVPGRGR
ncbi:hypothetical protein [Streptacidiphilus sp. ASG 303]|uniref:hypothetical protein n=1 Tax=Streptacidiphilus sp. ASG 303 TaxID=2896847 RepID=UPI00272CD74F|nr:hypothetical protein [Streptacidiphilus sp. ASG 303]